MAASAGRRAHVPARSCYASHFSAQSRNPEDHLSLIMRPPFASLGEAKRQGTADGWRVQRRRFVVRPPKSTSILFKIRRAMESYHCPLNLPLAPDNRAVGGNKDFGMALSEYHSNTRAVALLTLRSSRFSPTELDKRPTPSPWLLSTTPAPQGPA